jgi:hypothetical protein
VGGLVVVEHQVEGVGAGGQEDDFEDCIPCGVGEGPEDICMECCGRAMEGLVLARFLTSILEGGGKGREMAHPDISSRRRRNTVLAT